MRESEREGSAPAAAIFEPVQCTEGIYPGSRRFLLRAAKLVRDAGALVIFDEIYTGLGRAGARFYADRVGVRPDVMVIGKSLGNGFPISAFMGAAALVDAIPAGVQTSTFSGNPMGCAVACTVLELAEELELATRAEEIDDAVEGVLYDHMRAHGNVRAIRRAGALIGFDLCDARGTLSSAAAKAFAERAAARRLLIFHGGATGATTKMAPPLLLSVEVRSFLLETLDEAFRDQYV